MPLEEIQKILRHLNLQPLPQEGGLFAETYRSDDWLTGKSLPARYGAARRSGSAIYYALTREDFSAFHCLLTDEVYHFYLGDPVEMILLLPGGAWFQVVLGPDVLNGQQVQCVVPAGAWQALGLLHGGSFALMGTTMAPGFDPADFTLGERDRLKAMWPAAAEAIERYTRGQGGD